MTSATSSPATRRQLIRWVEDAVYWTTKGAATAPAGKETDPLKALLAIHDCLTDAPTLPEPD
ncbi:hypothetical protein [Roseomonas sp. KE0001]|uniref:hypothetical protein n=1 Tax=Roseomonas sp. KE0001 TaxID=2479201 RepID=UPI0018DF17FC|nr:hypothetical protein [Roseomonas sp. KE0001]MBI0432238.1 hypothetical protein [Roseomonas sp. KE0001]